MDSKAIAALPTRPPKAKGGVVYEYGTAVDCYDILPGDPVDYGTDCGALFDCFDQATHSRTGKSRVKVFRRVVTAAAPAGSTGSTPAAAAPTKWEQVGTTCNGEQVPTGQPRLAMSQILDAFHHTDFAVPTVNIQPEGDLTLVTLPTFYELQLPTSGFGPGEVDTVDPATMLGFTVRIRPSLSSVTYHFGDGQALGPTTSYGGPHPSGDVIHQYTSKGTYPVRADLTYGGQFQINGGPWNQIPGTVTVTGTPVPLTVKEARAHLTL